jgi:hypothetical protein
MHFYENQILIFFFIFNNPEDKPLYKTLGFNKKRHINIAWSAVRHKGASQFDNIKLSKYDEQYIMSK